MSADARARPRPSGRAQTLVGVMVLATLLAVAAGVLWAQRDPSPALLLSTATPEAAGPGLAGLGGAALAPRGAAQAYGPDTLHIKIDGKADLYLQSGFKRLFSQRFAPAGGGGRWAELYAYDMGSPRGAFAVFGQQRRAGAKALALAPLAYATDNAVYAAWGPWYLEAVGSEADPALVRDLAGLVGAFVAAHPRKAALPPELALLPRGHLVAGSYVLYRSGAFGYRGLGEVFAARYRIGGRPAMAFIAPQSGPEAAAKAMAAYAAFVLQNGGKELPAPGDIAGARLFELLGTYELLLARGPLVAGVHEAESPADAAALGAELSQRIKEAAP